MSDAHLAIVLHAHLPFIHHPEHESFLEEDWLFEAMTETYVPLLLALERLRRDRVPFRLTMSLTPTLLEMLAQPMLQQRYMRYLHQHIELAERETKRRNRADQERATARHYADRFSEVEAFFRARHRTDLVSAFREFQNAGSLQVLACAATHGFLPLMLTANAVRAQVAVGVNTVERHLGQRPTGIWLPEMAFKPGIDAVLADEGITHFILDAHGILNAWPTPPDGVHTPLRCPSGVAAFGRDLESSKQVWSADEGYPGDGVYREFYRDLGYDADYGEISPFLHTDGIRRNIGIKYHRVTGRVSLHEKQLYDHEQARGKAAEHGAHFVFCRQHQLSFLKSHITGTPIIVAPYDAELFGHWWYEGPDFLEAVFRTAAYVQSELQVCTLEEYCAEHPPRHQAMPSSSTWGDKGYYDVWLNGGNDWIYRHLHKAESRMIELAQTFNPQNPSTETTAALNQALRELLLAQSSDWAFLMTAGTATPYAEKRTRNHLHSFTRLCQMLRSGNIAPDYVRQLYELNPIFPDINFRVYL